MGTFLKNDDLGKLILRLTVGILMLFHGTAKILNPGTLDFIGTKLSAVGLPEFIAYGAYVGEVLAPILIVLGLWTRLGGFLVLGNMVFALYLVHMTQWFDLTKNGGWALELQGFFLLGGLALMFLGSGRFAIKPS